MAQRVTGQLSLSLDLRHAGEVVSYVGHCSLCFVQGSFLYYDFTYVIILVEMCLFLSYDAMQDTCLTQEG